MKNRSTSKKIIKFILSVACIALGLAVIYFGFITVTEYKPEALETLSVESVTECDKELVIGEKINIVSWNVGYCALSDTEDFFMDGGNKVRPDSSALIEDNLKNICETVKNAKADIVLLQEVDEHSRRSYYINEKESLSSILGGNYSYAYNFNVAFLPYPLPPIGQVKSGLFTSTKYVIENAERVQLPVPFKWPVRCANLKRCLSVNYIPVYEADGSSTDKKLVVINMHLEAYDSTDGRERQIKELVAVMEEEYKKGNYVIAGGDWNSTPSVVDMSKYPLVDTENFEPALISDDFIPNSLSWAFSDESPTCRLLSMPYVGNEDKAQFYVLDGFIVSNNVEVTETKVLNENFKYSDHNPVVMEIILR